ncbi:protein kish-A isoform X1 [Castor canadensis]|uniref:Protein kish-A isoform X1 n=1 Tax=Castor canadensis TaxID=51338 RepID=A0AC58MV38_CASCN
MPESWSLGGVTVNGQTGLAERPRELAGRSHLFRPGPGRVMWLGHRWPHYDYWEYFGSAPELVNERVLMLQYAVS